MAEKPTYEELENENRDLKKIYEVATVTDTSSSLEKTLQPIVVHITEVFNVSGCAILLWDRDKNQIENIIDYRKAYPKNVDESGRIYDLDKYPETLRALETNQIYHVQKGDPEADESELALMEEQEVFEILGLPLTENNRVLGLLEIYDDVELKKFTKQEIQLATALTSQAAIAVKNAQLYESAQSEIIKRKKTEESLLESETKFRGLIEASSDWIWEVDVKGVYKYSSPQVKTILGYEPDEILNKTLFDLLSPGDRQLVGQTFKSIVKNPCNLNNFEKRCLHKNGNIVILKTSGIPIINKAGILTGFRGVNRNITERKLAESSLQESRSNLLRSQYIARLGDFTWDLSSGAVIWSEGMHKLLKYDLNEKIDYAKVNSDIHHPDDLEHVTKWLKDSITSGNKKITPKEYRLVCKDGEILEVHTEGQIEYKDGKAVKLFGTCQDITERNQAEEELKQSEKNLNRMFQFADYMVCIADLEKGHFTKISPAFTKHLGWSEKEMLSKPILDFIHPTDVNKTTNIIKEQMEKEVDVIQFENRYKTKKGDFRWFEWSANPVPEEGITYSAAYDITERKRAEEEKEKQKQLLDATGSIANVGGWSIDAKTNELTWTEEVYRIFEIEDEFNPTIESAIQFWMPESRAIIESAVEGLLNTGETYDLTLEIKTAKDNFRWVHTIGKVNLKDGKIVNYYGSIQDITELKQTEEKKKQLEVQLQQVQKMESIGTLAGGIAHDFNNILFPIVGHSEMLLLDVPEDSPFKDGLNQIHTGALRASELVKQILTFSRQDNNELKLMKMQPIIKEALKLIRSTIPTTIIIKQTIQTECGAIKADPTQIHQIIMNLSTNAYHAMEARGGELKVSLKEIQLRADDLNIADMIPGVYACLIIADTGVGMNKDVREKIFDPFYSTKEIGKGTGMGLSVVHGIVKSMDGAIKVDSRPDKGTEFQIYLPLAEAVKKQNTTHVETSIQKGTEHILLVDDEDIVAAVVKQMLERLGYQVTSLTSSLEAIEAFRVTPNKFDILITDMQMPNMPGDKLAGELTKIRPDIPVLLCTGFSETMSEEKATSLGINGFLLKPIVMKDLSHKIREVLDKK